MESPAKAKTIEKFLGPDYQVMSSYGHIRDLKKKTFSIDTTTFKPEYEIPEEKRKLVADLRKAAKQAKTVWLASDEDREGEAISWHLKEVLGLEGKDTRRIVFHEITKPAILAAIENPRDIDKNLVDAQQARRVLDRIVGFKLSPILWRKVKPSLSAGRVQSVAVRLIVEREREVQNFRREDYFRVTALLTDERGNTLRAELNHRFKREEEAQAFLESCQVAEMRVADVQSKPMSRCPAPPFTTSTMQQEAAHKLRFSVAQTMTLAQNLYERGYITYMRTDSTNLSTLCLGMCRDYIRENIGGEYSRTRQFHTKAKGAQEAHEAIRPTDMSRTRIGGSATEQRLYNLIWQRTLACQMADAKIERTTAQIGISGEPYSFVANGEVVRFDGYLRVYRETEDENAEGNDNAEASSPDNREGKELPPLHPGQALTPTEINASQRFTQHPPRYNEASLVRKLEELGIGRPSTYASTITTIQQRQYVVKTDKEGERTDHVSLTLRDGGIRRSVVKDKQSVEKGKLVPTDVGIVVNDFLTEYFPDVLDYNFTAEVEKNFDEIAEGRMEWGKMIRGFYDAFNPEVEKTLESKSENRVGERVLGVDPKTGSPVSARVGRYGSYVQLGKQGEGEKPHFARLLDTQSIETITLEEALALFTLPRELGVYEGEKVSVDSGRFGPYVLFKGKYCSLPKGGDPMTITLPEAIDLIETKRKQDEERHMRQFEEEPGMEVLKGRYGPYISFEGKNYRLPKALRERASELTLEECRKVIREASTDKTSKTRGRTGKRAYGNKA